MGWSAKKFWQKDDYNISEFDFGEIMLWQKII